MGNAEQIAEWNGSLGQRWVEMQREIEAVVGQFGEVALKAAALQRGKKAIDSLEGRQFPFATRGNCH